MQKMSLHLTDTVVSPAKCNTMYKRKRKISDWVKWQKKTLTPTKKSNKEKWQHKRATKNFDYTTIADDIRTVSWSDDSHPAEVVWLNRITRTHHNSCVIEDTNMQIVFYSDIAKQKE